MDLAFVHKRIERSHSAHQSHCIRCSLHQLALVQYLGGNKVGREEKKKRIFKKFENRKCKKQRLDSPASFSLGRVSNSVARTENTSAAKKNICVLINFFKIIPILPIAPSFPPKYPLLQMLRRKYEIRKLRFE
jgi:hypothetical protein